MANCQHDIYGSSVFYNFAKKVVYTKQYNSLMDFAILSIKLLHLHHPLGLLAIFALRLYQVQAVFVN